MSSATATGSDGSTRRIFVACSVVCVLALTLWGAFRLSRASNSAAPMPERTSAELVRRAGLLWGTSANGPFTGWLVERYADGGLHSRSWIADGVLAGVSEGWATNGVLLAREHFVAGLSEGPVIRWRDDGSKLSEGTTRAGKLEGVFRRWHPNGQLAEEVVLRAGAPDGPSHAWFPSGFLKAEVQLVEGKAVSQRFWKDGEKDGGLIASAKAGSP
jgi:hypothetical protein